MLIKDAIHLIQSHDIHQEQPVSWADLGCGSGLFTRALATLLPPGSTIYAVDRTWQNIAAVPGISVSFIQADIEQPVLPLPSLEGILMANVLHYVKDKPQLIKQLQQYFKDSGRFIVVEYDTMRANPWVPYPINFAALQSLFAEAGYKQVQKLGERRSVYRNGLMYAALIQ